MNVTIKNTGLMPINGANFDVSLNVKEVLGGTDTVVYSNDFESTSDKLVNKDRYSLIDCDHKKNCTSKGCNSPQVLYLREGDSLDIKTIFGNGVDNIFVSTDGSDAKFKSATQDNVSSVTYKKNGTVTQLPFILRSDDSLEVIISKMDNNLNANIVLIGNLIK